MKRIPPYLIFNKQVELPCSPFVEQAAKVFQHQYIPKSLPPDKGLEHGF
jgi:hypothetical protein